MGSPAGPALSRANLNRVPVADPVGYSSQGISHGEARAERLAHAEQACSVSRMERCFRSFGYPLLSRVTADDFDGTLQLNLE